jgi:hypothetical protein
MKFPCICGNFNNSNKEILSLVFFISSTKSYSRLVKTEEDEGFVIVEVDLWAVEAFFIGSEVEGEYMLWVSFYSYYYRNFEIDESPSTSSSSSSPNKL